MKVKMKQKIHKLAKKFGIVVSISLSVLAAIKLKICQTKSMTMAKGKTF